MDMIAVIQLFNDNPACYFVVGLLLGYTLRGLRLKPADKKTGRYQTTPHAHKRNSGIAEMDEPPFDWSVASATVKTVTSSRLGTIALDEQGHEI